MHSHAERGNDQPATMRAYTPAVTTPANAHRFPSSLTPVLTHFHDLIVPLWQGPGWNADLALPFEALDADHQPLPPSAIAPWPAPGSCTCSPA